jgi:hypothetical protein
MDKSLPAGRRPARLRDAALAEWGGPKGHY